MKTLKLLAFAFATCMFACNSPEKETVRPVQEASSERVSSASSDPFPCSLTTSDATGGIDLMNKLNSATGCKQPACLNVAEDLGKITLDIATPASWTSTPYNPTQMQGFIDQTNSYGASILSQLSCQNPNNSKIYSFTYKWTGIGAGRKVYAEISFYCCDGNVIDPD